MPKRASISQLDVWKELGAVTEDTGVRTLKEAKLIDIAHIRPNPRQPRRSFDAQALRELAESIRERGLLQPIVVRYEGDGFVIIAGHRRYEACKLIDMDRIPAMIREASDHEALEQSLIENIQREDIAPVEEALCYRQLMDEHNYSIREMAARMHKSVGYIHGRLELLKHPDIADSVSQAEIGVFEARELAKIEDEELRRELTRKVADGRLNRDTLKREVRKHTGKAQQRLLFNPRTFSRRWQRLRRDLETLDAEALSAEEQQQARQLLEEIQRTIAQTLSQIP